MRSEDIQRKELTKAFLGYSIPCIIGMFLTSFMTIVDGMFIGWKIGEKGLAAIKLLLILSLFLSYQVLFNRRAGDRNIEPVVSD